MKHYLDSEYEIFYCKGCKKTIHHFKCNPILKDFHCWDCVRSDSRLEELNEIENKIKEFK